MCVEDGPIQFDWTDINANSDNRIREPGKTKQKKNSNTQLGRSIRQHSELAPGEETS
jgi:hypothetical protein